MTFPADNRPMGAGNTATVAENGGDFFGRVSDQAAIPLSAGVEIHWGGKVYVFASKAEALRMGFHLD